MSTSMSLHRVIAEIKNLEAKLATINKSQFVFFSETNEPNQAQYEAVSQGDYDKTQAGIANLAALKSVRNKANSTITVSIGGKTMTIDEALAQKAALPFKQALIATMTAQFVGGTRQMEQAKVQIEAKIQQQIATMFTGTRKATEEEVNVIRKTFEIGKNPQLIHAVGLKDRIEELKKEVENFTTEVDFVLSEANATNKVEVILI